MPVSLSQINSFTADATLGSGQPAVVIDNSQAINNVLQAANIKAEYDWNKYQQFLKNQDNFYKNLGDLSKIEVATQDRRAIINGYKNILAQALEHPEIFHGRNQRLFGELQGASAQLMQDATESKLNRLYDLSNQQYLSKNPELQTPENIQKLQEFWKQPLGQRENYILTLPGLFNPDELAKTINEQIEQPYSETLLIGGLEGEGEQQKRLPGEKYILEEEGKAYDPKRFLTLAEQAFDLQDKRGNVLRTEVQRRFTALDPSIQQQYGGNAKNWYLDLMKARIKPRAVEKKDLKENQNFYKAEELRQGWARIGLDREKLNKEKSEDILGADAILNEAFSILEKGALDRKVRTLPDGEKINYFVIAEPTLLESFSKIDKDGKLINQPDEVQYNPDKGELELIYLQKNLVTGQPQLRNGKRIIKDTKKMDERTWLKLIAKRSFPNKDIGAINTLVESVVKQGGGNLYEIVKKTKQPQSENIATPQNFKNKAKLQDGTLIYSLDGKTWYNEKGEKIQ